MIRKVLNVQGMVFLALAGVMMIPACVDLSQNAGLGFIISGMFCCFLGGVLFLSYENKEALILREKILSMLLTCISVPLLASLPFFTASISGTSFLDCFFETTSALTTTGGSIIPNARDLSDGLLLWRSLLQLFGGIGFIALWIYVLPNFWIPAVAWNYMGRTALWTRYLKILGAVYVISAAVGSLLLAGTGMAAMEAVCSALDAVSSGGISGITPPAGHWKLILLVLMFISGVPITILKNLETVGSAAFHERQFLCYCLVIFIGSMAMLVYQMLFLSDSSFYDATQASLLAVVSSLTTTGCFATQKYSPVIESFLYMLSFCGGCAGSCTGGIKIFRLLMVFVIIKGHLMQLTRRNAVYVLTYSGKKLEESDITSLFSYFLCYLIFAALTAFLLAICDMDLGQAFGAVLTSINNNGPFFGSHRATAEELYALAPSAKVILIVSMIAGRLEFVAFAAIFTKQFWKK
ncbi:MAG: hypothetical protein LBS14_01635 [Holosporaceae bacterium]|jgi:trk system potassium uptake protein TrkH|nr:hypothetical protein [Holosporaceae bacterium]